MYGLLWHEIVALVLVVLVVIVYGPSWVRAAEKAQDKKSCEIQLSEHAVRVHQLATDREDKEKKVAELQTALYYLNQQKQALEKQLEAFKPKEDKKE